MRPAAARLLRHLLVVTVAAAVVAAAGSAGGYAYAQTADDVRRAREATEAAERDAAAAGAGRDAAVTALLEAAAAYDVVTADLARVTYATADLQEETATVEATVRELRQVARAVVTAAYIAGDDDMTLLFSADSLLDALVGREILDRVAGRHLLVLEELEAARHDLDGRRHDLEMAASRTAALRRDADALSTRLGELAAGAEAALRSARADVVAAAASYELTAAAYEALVNSIGPATAQWRPLVEAYFPEDLVWEALAVMQCESRGVPEAVNAASSATGLFQFLPGTWAYSSVAAGFAGADPRDPEANVAAAAWLVSHSGLIGNSFGRWGPWECRPGGPFLPWPPRGYPASP